MSADLSASDLKRVTGYSQPSRQVEVLRGMGLHPIIRPDGSPCVTWAALTMAMTGHANSAAATRPDFSALKRAG